MTYNFDLLFENLCLFVLYNFDLNLSSIMTQMMILLSQGYAYQYNIPKLKRIRQLQYNL